MWTGENVQSFYNSVPKPRNFLYLHLYRCCISIKTEEIIRSILFLGAVTILTFRSTTHVYDNKSVKCLTFSNFSFCSFSATKLSLILFMLFSFSSITFLAIYEKSQLMITSSTLFIDNKLLNISLENHAIFQKIPTLFILNKI